MERANLTWNKITSEKALGWLDHHLRQTRYNSWTVEHFNKNDRPICFVGIDHKPESDWSKPEHLFALSFSAPHLSAEEALSYRDRAIKLLEKHQKEI